MLNFIRSKKTKRPLKLFEELNEERVLLHCCCAPCSGEIIRKIVELGITPHLYFYNPNIDNIEEYTKRKKEVIRLAAKYSIPFADGDYINDKDLWESITVNYQDEPERGSRCTLCLQMRLDEAARHAYEHEFKIFTSTLGISRWKNFEQVTMLGKLSANNYSDLFYWDLNWRKQGGSERMHKIAKEEEMYQQNYCGCMYSKKTDS